MNAQPLALERNPVKSLLSQEVMKKKFEEVLGQKAPQFMASISNAGLQLPGVDPMSIIAAAFVAATLDLPIDKNLGFAHIVPYKDKSGNNIAQFQMGYKGFIQLALRTGQYERMNSGCINAEAFGGYDEVGEPKIHWDLLDETKDAVGYAFAWKLTSGFIKVIYWTKKKVEAHAKRYSQAVRSGKQNTPWIEHKDAMGLKTVVKYGLSHWGIMSVQMQQAIVHDQGAQKSIDGKVDYVDGTTVEPTQEDNNPKTESSNLSESLKKSKETRELNSLKSQIHEVLLSTGSDQAGMDSILKNASEFEATWFDMKQLSQQKDAPRLRMTLDKIKTMTQGEREPGDEF